MNMKSTIQDRTPDLHRQIPVPRPGELTLHSPISRHHQPLHQHLPPIRPPSGHCSRVYLLPQLHQPLLVHNGHKAVARFSRSPTSSANQSVRRVILFPVLLSRISVMDVWNGLGLPRIQLRLEPQMPWFMLQIVTALYICHVNQLMDFHQYLLHLQHPYHPQSHHLHSHIPFFKMHLHLLHQRHHLHRLPHQSYNHMKHPLQMTLTLTYPYPPPTPQLHLPLQYKLVLTHSSSRHSPLLTPARRVTSSVLLLSQQLQLLMLTWMSIWRLTLT